MSALLRLVRIAVVVAAGVGAWFGYDAYVEADDTTESADGVPVAATPAPWAELDLVVADTAWSGPTRSTIQTGGDVVRQATSFDPSSGRAQMTLFDAAGTVDAVVEIDDNEVYASQGGAGWEVPTDETLGGATTLRDAAYTAPPPTLVDLVPELVWPYTKIMSDVPGGEAAAPTRVLTIRMKGGAFAAAEPARAAQWRSNSYRPHLDGRVEIEVELDATGHVVRLEYVMRDDSVYEFESLEAAPVFEAPFAD
jgi:hypothetical protein